MATYTEIQTRVTRRLIDLPTAVSTEVPALVNKAMRELQKRHNFDVQRAETGLTSTTVSTRVVDSVPSDWKEVRRRPYYVTDLGNVVPLIWAPSRSEAVDYFTYDDANDIGPPQLIAMGLPTTAGARNFEVWPYPDGASDYDDGEYQINIPYWRYLSDLSSGSDTNWFTVNAEDYLYAQAVAEGFKLDWDWENAALWEQQAAKEFALVVQTDKKQTLALVETMVPHKGARTPRLEF